MEKQDFLKDRARILRVLQGKSWREALILCGSALNEHLAFDAMVATISVQPVTDAFAVDNGAAHFMKELAGEIAKISA